MTKRLLRLMGPPRLTICRDDGTEESLHLSRTSLALVALVALQGAGGMSRAVVAEALWPATTSDKAVSRLSSALWRAHGPDGTALLAGDHGRIGLVSDAQITVDVLQLADRIETLRRRDVSEWPKPEVAALDAALSLRSGGFLDGLEGDWVTAAQQRCADIYETGLEMLIRYHRHNNHVDRSIALTRQLVRHDPYREDMQAVLVELYNRKGQPGRAVSQYALARDLLQRDLGVGPGDALKKSLSAMMERSAPSSTAELDQHEVLERLKHLDANIARLTRQIAEIRSLLAVDRHDAAQAHRAGNPVNSPPHLRP